MMEVGKGERLAKRMSRAGLCSRRDGERWILEGRVQVDGQLVTTPATLVQEGQLIQVDGIPLSAEPKPQLWGYYKATGVLTTHQDPQGRPILFDLLPANMPRVISMGRLDLNSEGLILLTTDSKVARYGELPATGWARSYRVRVYGSIQEDKLLALSKGIEIDGIRYGAIQVDVGRKAGQNTWLFITLWEGKNREIRKVMEHLGLRVNRLIRVTYGPFALEDRQPGDLWEIPFKEFRKYFPHLGGAQEVSKEKSKEKAAKAFSSRKVSGGNGAFPNKSPRSSSGNRKNKSFKAQESPFNRTSPEGASSAAKRRVSKEPPRAKTFSKESPHNREIRDKQEQKTAHKRGVYRDTSNLRNTQK